MFSFSEPQPGRDCELSCGSKLDPLVVLERAAFRKALSGALDAQPMQEQSVMTYYYGKGRTMREIGGFVGVTESRISQIHCQAIARLRVAVLGGEEQRSLLAPRRKSR